MPKVVALLKLSVGEESPEETDELGESNSALSIGVHEAATDSNPKHNKCLKFMLLNLLKSVLSYCFIGKKTGKT